MKVEIPIYNILNMFLTGFVFIGCIVIQFTQEVLNLLNTNTYESVEAFSKTFLLVCGFAAVYAIGEALNRIGSVLLEPLLRKFEIIRFNDDYELYNEAKKKFPILDTLSREYAFSRTSSLEFLILFAIALFFGKCKFILVFCFLSVVYILSCRKYAAKIVELMEKSEKNINADEKEQ